MEEMTRKMGWLRDYPDYRDFSFNQAEIPQKQNLLE